MAKKPEEQPKDQPTNWPLTIAAMIGSAVIAWMVLSFGISAIHEQSAAPERDINSTTSISIAPSFQSTGAKSSGTKAKGIECGHEAVYVIKPLAVDDEIADEDAIFALRSYVRKAAWDSGVTGADMVSNKIERDEATGERTVTLLYQFHQKDRLGRFMRAIRELGLIPRAAPELKPSRC